MYVSENRTLDIFSVSDMMMLQSCFEIQMNGVNTVATIERRKNANGEVVSCRIVVCCGYDSSGKKIIRRKAWKPDPQKSQRQNEKDLHIAAISFEQGLPVGQQSKL